jgi:hypothetical protein
MFNNLYPVIRRLVENIEDENFWNEGIKAIKNMLNEFKELKDKNDN